MVQVLFFYLCNYAYEQAAGLAAQPPRLAVTFKRSIAAGSIFGGIDSHA